MERSLMLEISADIAESHVNWLKSQGIINTVYIDNTETQYTEEVQDIFNEFYNNHLQILNKYFKNGEDTQE